MFLEIKIIIDWTEGKLRVVPLNTENKYIYHLII